MLGITVAYTEHLYNSIPQITRGAVMSFNLSADFAVALVLAFVRSVAWVTICPPFSNSAIPRMVKIGFAGAFAFFAAGTLQHDPLPQSDAQVVVADRHPGRSSASCSGYVVSLFVTAVVGAGRLVDLFSGVNLPQAIDPLVPAAVVDLRSVLQPRGHRAALHDRGGRRHRRGLREVVPGGGHELSRRPRWAHWPRASPATSSPSSRRRWRSRHR